jgi:hypothetical protein
MQQVEVRWHFTASGVPEHFADLTDNDAPRELQRA